MDRQWPAPKYCVAARVLYTSGYTDNAIVHEGHLDPGVALLPKPYRKSDLSPKIREMLADGPPLQVIA
ncbi:hypothetical protein [Bradyrhizobium sp. LB11.1]|uniref:hypothetical protein n=1 Tax=Bradyrhizobium sp. LB11.1 TaxID=3156326 RepID=UPI003395640B